MRDGLLEVWISVDGERLPEVALAPPVKIQTRTVCDCWIRSEAGKKFSTKWRDLSPKRGIWLQFSVDGIPIGANGYGRYSSNCGGYRAPPGSVDGWLVSNHTRKSFTFSTLRSTADTSKTGNQGLGTIEVQVYIAKIGEKTSDNIPCLTFQDLEPVVKSCFVSAKLAAQQNHCVQPGDKIEVEDLHISGPIKASKDPFVIFRFHYGPLAMPDPLIVARQTTHTQYNGQGSATQDDNRRYRLRQRKADPSRSRPTNQSLHHPNVADADEEQDIQVVAEICLDRLTISQDPDAGSYHNLPPASREYSQLNPGISAFRRRSTSLEYLDDDGEVDGGIAVEGDGSDNMPPPENPGATLEHHDQGAPNPNERGPSNTAPALKEEAASPSFEGPGFLPTVDFVAEQEAAERRVNELQRRVDEAERVARELQLERKRAQEDVESLRRLAEKSRKKPKLE
ncbi:hypothetical protein JAAARDRAFT_40931 [Jaapia argillacea MUCL 33604]|uniref:Uncharacterized protein n=1 Tax=Jaapia argillacea MUCL 33604 TaxID=933084 RepID=A0A067P9U6_9AGAM|nr:hypothetical protein JAAARDRAFT_40931 [Jaapia argillacea MUCL 33604]